MNADNFSTKHTLSWRGPFSWVGRSCPSIFDCDFAEGQGIYIWSVPTPRGNLIYYVGQTGVGFAKRQYEHFTEYTSGAYTILEPLALRDGRKEILYEGFNYREPKWRHGEQFVKQSANLLPVIPDLMETIQFWLGPVEVDRRLRERIEGAIIQALDDIKEPGLHLQDANMHRVFRNKETEPAIIVEFEPADLFRGLPQQLEA